GEPRALQRITDSGRLNSRFVCPDCASWLYSQPRGGGVRVRAGSPWVTSAEGDEIFETQPIQGRGPDRLDRSGDGHLADRGLADPSGWRGCGDCRGAASRRVVAARGLRRPRDLASGQARACGASGGATANFLSVEPDKEECIRARKDKITA